jgi:hypothetical protein
VRRITGKQTTRKKVGGGWPDKGRLKTAVLVDVDGCLAGKYYKGKREIRPNALGAIKMLSEHAPVFLWSIVSGNAERLLAEFPQLGPYVAGCYGKNDFPFGTAECLYCIDDVGSDEALLKCHHVIILNETYNGGPCSGLLMNAVKIIVDHISQEME